jgi:SAM-dependent methyltransferase
VPEGSLGLDLGSRSRVREDAITLDVEAAEGVDVVGDGHEIPFVDSTFDYVWCNAVLEHVRKPWIVADEIVRVLKPGGVAVIQVPFLENVHGWPDDYYRFTPNGLRTLFEDLDEVAAGVSAGPGQVLPDLLVYYASAFADIQGGGLLRNIGAVVLGTLVLPFRYLDQAARKRPSWWKWARGFYFVGRKPTPPARATAPGRPRAIFITPSPHGAGFEEIMRLRTREMVQTLKERGVEVAVAEARSRDDWLDAFNADFYLAPNLNYLLMANLDADSVYHRHPRAAALLWDDPLGALALWYAQVRGGWMGSLNRRESGVLERFRSLLAIEGARHFAWDSGHIEAATGLGLVDPSHVEWYEIATYAPFLDQGHAPQVEPHIDVSFSGNIYEAALAKTNFQTDQFYVEMTDRITATKVRELGRSAWEILRCELDALPDDERTERGLHPDESPFWDYYLHAVWLASTTVVRTSLMTQIARPVHLFGVFADPESVRLLKRYPNLVYASHAHHYRELPQVFASTKVNVCISNGLIYQGVPSKLIDCLASGGFALVDPKDDLERLFGPEVEAIVFRNAEELNAKIEYYLSRPNERREIVATLRESIEQRCTLEHLLTRVLRALGPGPSGSVTGS